MIVVITIATGLILNHTDALQLGSKHLRPTWINAWYGRAAPTLEHGFETPVGWFSQIGSQLSFDGREFRRDVSPLRGALWNGTVLYVLCADHVLELDKKLTVLDQYTSLDGLAAPLMRIGLAGSGVVIETARGVMELDPVTATWGTYAASSPPRWNEQDALPAEIASDVAAQFAGEGVTAERVMLDLHSGRLFGRWGVWIVDAAAVALLLLALSGVYLYFKFKRNGNAPRRVGPNPPP